MAYGLKASSCNSLKGMSFTESLYLKMPKEVGWAEFSLAMPTYEAIGWVQILRNE